VELPEANGEFPGHPRPLQKAEDDDFSIGCDVVMGEAAKSVWSGSQTKFLCVIFSPEHHHLRVLIARASARNAGGGMAQLNIAMLKSGMALSAVIVLGFGLHVQVKALSGIAKMVQE
jgi:hypothetical protein